MAQAPYGIHWFRRDLRLAGNPALEANLRRHPGRVLGLFCFDPVFLARPDFSPDRFGFFLETLRALRDEMRDQGGDLLVLDRGPDRAFEAVLGALGGSKAGKPALVSFNRDYEPFALDRDARIQKWLERDRGIDTVSMRDHLVIEPMELTKPDPKSPYYQVFTPFRRKWLTLAHEEDAIRERLRAGPSRAPKFALTWKDRLGASKATAGAPPRAASALRDALDEYAESNAKHIRVPLPPAGRAAALEALRRFKGKRLEAYAAQRDTPSIAGTSQLSIYLKNGSLTVAEVVRELGLAELTKPPGKTAPKSGEFTFLSELIWREFYYHVLAHFPFVETQAFDPAFRGIRWRNDEREFAAWKEGRTGFPIVDAGMRQLAATGWMHNRVRMIVASFLVKDLLVDWRWGERYFMERLLDGDLAPNNGGWQWAASTGVDPNPYFRIFNPALQEAKFDSKQEYIRRWIPEFGTARYPAPIVDHAERKAETLAEYKRAVREARSARTR